MYTKSIKQLTIKDRTALGLKFINYVSSFLIEYFIINKIIAAYNFILCKILLVFKYYF